MRASATDILRAHSVERRRRRSLASPSLDGEGHASMPRMSEERWVESLQLVAGIDEATLELLEVWHNDHAGTRQETILVEIQGQDHEVRTRQVAIPLRLTEAAALVGRPMPYAVARDLLRQAIAQVDEQLVARAGRIDG